MEENFLKLTHVQRQEAAQSRREEKKRAEKERIMNEEDPEKQRRLEVRWIFRLLNKLLAHFSCSISRADCRHYQQQCLT